MESIFRKLIGICVVSFPLLGYSQHATLTSGGNASGSGGNVSFSIGQIVYTTTSYSTGSLAQGIQHAYEVVGTGIQETSLIISLSAFPNPTTGDLTLQIDNYSNEQLSYQLFDVQGKLLNSGQILAQQTQINTANLPQATYFLKVLSVNDEVKAFKIIKN